MTVSAGDFARAAEAAKDFGGDRARAAEAAMVAGTRGTVIAADSARGSEAAKNFGGDRARCTDWGGFRAAGTDSAHGADTGSFSHLGIDSARAAEAAKDFGGDRARAAESAGVRALVFGPDTSRAADTSVFRTAGVDSGHAVEGVAVGSARGADVARAVEGASFGSGAYPHSGDYGRAVESGLYYHTGSGMVRAGEGFSVSPHGADRSLGADLPQARWPASADRCRSREATEAAWPSASDTAAGADRSRPLSRSGADAAHGSDVMYEVGIWTYAASGVRLLLRGQFRTAAELAAHRVRMTAAASRLAGRSWARITLRPHGEDRAGGREEGTIPARWGD